MTPLSGKSIVFFGTGEFSLTTLTGLIEASYEIAAVVTKPDTEQSRGHILTPPPVKVIAQRNNIPVWQPQKVSDIYEDISALNFPVGILASYGKIIPDKILGLFRPGIINIHPSLLPLYRGPSPIEASILNGDEKTGVSIMQLAEKMDAGPVYTAKEYPLKGSETKPELFQALAHVGVNLLLESLPQIVDGSLQPRIQNEEKATYTPLLSKNDAKVDPDQQSAIEIERSIRAYLGFPRTTVTVSGHTIIVTKARVNKIQSSPMDVRCADGNYLSIEELIAPSGRRMSASDFARGYLTSRG